MLNQNKGLKAIALLEALKGTVSLCVGFGLHHLAGENLGKLAESIVNHLHLNPASHFPSILITAARSFSDKNVSILAFVAFVYAAVRFIEAYGLWRELVWIEWFALASGAIYLPFEIYEVIFNTSIVGVCLFLLNVLVVSYMAYILFSKKKLKKHLN